MGKRERERERGGGGGGRATVQFLFICARPRVRTQYLCMQMALSEDTQQRKVENRKKYKLGNFYENDQFTSPYGKQFLNEIDSVRCVTFAMVAGRSLSGKDGNSSRPSTADWQSSRSECR